MSKKFQLGDTVCAGGFIGTVTEIRYSSFNGDAVRATVTTNGGRTLQVWFRNMLKVLSR